MFFHFKNALLFLLFVHVVHIEAQSWIVIPDSNMASYFQSIVPAAMNGNQMDTSNSLITSTTFTLHIPVNNIGSLYGIQFFKSLRHLECEQNPNPGSQTPNTFTAIPTLPNTLLYLDCSGNWNNLLSLPLLPTSLKFINCGFNSHVLCLPNIPDSLNTLECQNCNISCFPVFPNSITSLNIQSNPFDCLPNYLACMNSTTLAFPLCTSGNSNSCEVAGITEYITNNTTTILYPNPIINNLYLNLHAKCPGTMLVSISDMNGRLLYNQNYNAGVGANSYKLDLSNFEPGVYFVNITDADGVPIKQDKVMVSR